MALLGAVKRYINPTEITYNLYLNVIICEWIQHPIIIG